MPMRKAIGGASPADDRCRKAGFGLRMAEIAVGVTNEEVAWQKHPRTQTRLPPLNQLAGSRAGKVTRSSSHSTCPQKSGILAVGLADVAGQPGSQEFHQGQAEQDGAGPILLFEVGDLGR